MPIIFFTAAASKQFHKLTSDARFRAFTLFKNVNYDCFFAKENYDCWQKIKSLPILVLVNMGTKICDSKYDISQIFQ